MKNNYIFVFAFFFILFTIESISQSGVEKKNIATLGPDEYLANGENCFLLDKNPESISFVTVVGSGSAKEYYCYGKDGKKTGPVKQPDKSYWSECEEINIEDCMADHEPKVGNLEEYIDWGTGTVNFKGNKYGPFGQIVLFYLSDDEQNFYSVALSTEMKIYFFDNSNRKIELNGIPEQILISPDGKRAIANVKGSFNPFDPDAAQKMLANPEEMNNPKINLYGIDGVKYGPYTSDSFSGTWYAPSGKLVINANSEISLDGRLLFKSDEFLSKCDIWVSNNGKDFAWANYEYLVFSDGTKFTAPLVIRYVENGGKGYLRWVSLEDGKNLNYYRKAL